MQRIAVRDNSFILPFWGSKQDLSTCLCEKKAGSDQYLLAQNDDDLLE